MRFMASAWRRVRCGGDSRVSTRTRECVSESIPGKLTQVFGRMSEALRCGWARIALDHQNKSKQVEASQKRIGTTFASTASSNRSGSVAVSIVGNRSCIKG